jgi:hypothetical protein
MEDDHAEHQAYTEMSRLVEQETCTDVLNLPLREWVLAYLVYVTSRSGQRVPTAVRPYAISKTLKKPIWAIEKSLVSLVNAGFAKETPLGPFGRSELVLIQRISAANPSKERDWIRGEWLQRIQVLYGEKVARLVKKVQSGGKWPCVYFVTPEGKGYLDDVLRPDEDSLRDLVFDWLLERTEPRMLWLPSMPTAAEAIGARHADPFESARWEPVPWDRIGSHLEMLDRPARSERMRESLIRLERWKRENKSRKHSRIFVIPKQIEPKSQNVRAERERNRLDESEKFL